MTLVELLVAISIMVVIIGTVAIAIAFVARSTVPTTNSAGQADNLMIVDAYWAEDVAASRDFVNVPPSNPAAAIATITASSGCSSVAGTAFAWFYYQPDGTHNTYSVVYSYSGSTVTRTVCTLSPNKVTTLTTTYSGSGPPVVSCVTGSVIGTCASRGSSTGVSFTLPLSKASIQGVITATTPVFVGSWMISAT